MTNSEAVKKAVEAIAGLKFFCFKCHANFKEDEMPGDETPELDPVHAICPKCGDGEVSEEADEIANFVLAAQQWFMHRSNRGIPHTKSLEDAETQLEEVVKKYVDMKISMIQKHIDADRAASPDGMTAWDRVEKFRVEHGHLPGDAVAARSCNTCLGTGRATQKGE